MNNNILTYEINQYSSEYSSPSVARCSSIGVVVYFERCIHNRRYYLPLAERYEGSGDEFEDQLAGVFDNECDARGLQHSLRQHR